METEASFGISTFSEGSCVKAKTNEDEGDYSDIQSCLTALHASNRNYRAPEAWRK